MNLKILDKKFSVCKLNDDKYLPLWVLSGETFVISKIENELSVVCEASCVPEDITSEDGFRIMQVVGKLDFSLIGIIADISRVLKKAEISIFVVSTYDTDYILVKEDKLAKAVKFLGYEGYSFV